jgi:G:T-mismatch repair DNA endonuclease (very short patch repair protein)
LVRHCSVENCPNIYRGRGFCSKHYQKWRRHGDPLYVASAEKHCSVENCPDRYYGKGFCANHYRKWKRHGDPLHVVDTEKLCSVENCPNKHWGKGFCPIHYQKWKRYGNPLYVFDPEKRRKNHSIAMKGRKLSEDHRKKISEARIGMKLSEATKKKLSEAHKNPSQETRKRMSEAGKGKIISEATRKKITEYQNRPEVLERNRQQLRDRRHDQVRPNKSEMQVAKILTDDKIKFKMFQNVEYHNNEKKIRKKEIDFLIKPKKIIEYNGYYHFDNRKYKPNEVKVVHGKSTLVKDVWKQEETVLNQIKKEGYRILIIWDSDLKKDIENTTKKILKFAKS